LVPNYNWYPTACRSLKNRTKINCEQKSHQNKIAKLLFVAQPRQSLQFSGFQGRALELVDGDRREVSSLFSFSF